MWREPINQHYSAHLSNIAAQQFTLPMINIIQPKLVICLGLDTFNTGQLGRNNRNRGQA